MKISKLLQLSSIILLMNCAAISHTFSQKSYIKDRWNMKASYSRYTTGSKINNKAETTGHYRIEGNYGLFNFIETGLYVGYSGYYVFSSKSLQRESYSTPFYGINLNFHLLPFLVSQADFRFDLYATTKYGGRYIPTPSNYYYHGHYPEYGIGAGLAFYLWKHAGVFAEYSYGKFHFGEGNFIKDNTKLRYGLSFKF